MKILIYGAGVIGSLYASLLSGAGVDVSVYARGKRLERLLENGLLYKKDNQIKTARVTVISEVHHDDLYDFIFLTVRENQLRTALAELKDNVSPIALLLGFVYRSDFGDKFMYRHSMKAPDEMKRLHEQFYDYLKENQREGVV